MIRMAAKAYQHRERVRSFLQFCESTESAFAGTVRPEELEFLNDLVLLANSMAGPIVEIGTLFGFTTQHLARWKCPEKTLVTVDNYSWNPVGFSEADHRHFTQRILYYLTETCNTQVFDGTSQEFAKSYNGPTPAMVFIDASHVYRHVKEDIDWARQMQIPIIAGHDYSDEWQGVKRAVDEAFGADKRVVSSIWARVCTTLPEKRTGPNDAEQLADGIHL